MPPTGTDRRTFLRHGLAAVAAGTTGQALGADPIWQSTVPTTRPFERPFRLLCAPVLTNPSPDGVTVLWATNAPSTGWVEYGPTEQLGQRATGWDQGLLPYWDRYAKIRLTGLRPGTRYYYRVHAEYIVYDWHQGILNDVEPPVASAVYSFTTPNPQATEVRFTVWNDTHEHPDTLRALHAAHERHPDDFLVWNGDIGTDLYAYDRMLEQYLDPAGQPFAARVPYYFVRGNHDTRGPYARRIGEVVDVPDGRFYYTFRQGPLAAMVLDTGEPVAGQPPFYRLSDFEPLRALETEWLAQAIERPEFRDAPFRVVFCHIPLWWRNEQSLGTYCLDARHKWHDLLVRGRIHMIISGHTHDYDCYLANDEHPYVQLIGGDHRPPRASYIQGHATKKELTVVQYHLSGKVLHKVVMPT